MKKLVLILPLTLLFFCMSNDEFEPHTNVYDRIFDDGAFRIVLDRSSEVTLRWSNLYSTKYFDSVFSTFDRKIFIMTSGKVLKKNGYLTEAEIGKIKAGEALTSLTAHSTFVQRSDGSLDNAVTIATATVASPVSYVLELSYTYLGSASKVMHSNTVVIEN